MQCIHSPIHTTPGILVKRKRLVHFHQAYADAIERTSFVPIIKYHRTRPKSVYYKPMHHAS